MKQVEIYTDGACKNNPGPGGWGAILISKTSVKEMYGNAQYTTNNRMELMAVIRALEFLENPCKITLYSDSQYIIHAFTLGWLDRWIKNGWRLSKNKPVKNVDLWKELYEIQKKHEMKWVWIRGHSGNKYNERADYLATSAIDILLDI